MGDRWHPALHQSSASLSSFLLFVVLIAFPATAMALALGLLSPPPLDWLLRGQSGATSGLAAVQGGPRGVALTLTQADWQIPDGHFYTQTVRQPSEAGKLGYGVVNADGLPFWDEYQRLGGPDVVGYPLSNRFFWQGYVVQVFQRGVFHAWPGTSEVRLLDVLDELSRQGKDPWLLETYGVPQPLPADFDQGRRPEEVRQARLQLLDAAPQIKAHYEQLPNADRLLGLPTSRVEDVGDALAVRFQRGVLWMWQQDTVRGRGGEVVLLNAGEIAIAAGLFPQEHLEPEEAPALPPFVLEDATARQDAPTAAEGGGAAPEATPAAQPTPAPTPAAAQEQRPQRVRVANTDRAGVYLRRTPNLNDRLRAWPDNTILVVVGEDREENGLRWKHVRDPAGNVGWVPARYTAPAD